MTTRTEILMQIRSCSRWGTINMSHKAASLFKFEQRHWMRVGICLGDWGLFITRALAYKYPQYVKAHHVNWAFAAKPSFTASNPEPTYSEREKKQMRQHDRWFPYGSGDGRGYIAIQSTKPATINFLLKDSPVGLLAWIYDKLIDWTDSYPWTEEEVCLWVSLYVFSTAGPEAATFVYYEALHDTSNISIEVVQSYIDV